MELRDVKETVEIHTNVTPTTCPECREAIYMHGGDKIDSAINHLLDHGFSLLHVGSEWGEDRDGKTISHTVAILGR